MNDYRTRSRAALAIARTTLRGGDDRPRRAIDTAERWLDGQATTRDLQAAKFAAYDYAHAGGNPAAAYAASAVYGCSDGIGLGHYIDPYIDAVQRAAERR